jgi:hypothetical protein
MIGKAIGRIFAKTEKFQVPSSKFQLETWNLELGTWNFKNNFRQHQKDIAGNSGALGISNVKERE